MVAYKYLEEKAKEYFGVQTEEGGWTVDHPYRYAPNSWSISAFNKGISVEIARYPRDKSEYVAIRFLVYGGIDNEVLFNVSVVGNSPEVSLRKMETIRDEVTEQLESAVDKVRDLLKSGVAYGET